MNSSSDCLLICQVFNITPCDICSEIVTHSVIQSTPVIICPLWKTVQAYLVILICIIAIIGNSIVVQFSRKEKNLSYIQLLRMLSYSDITFAVVRLLIMLPSTWNCQWIYALFFCKIFPTLSEAGILISIGFIFIISLERYLGIVRPGRFTGLPYTWRNRMITANIILTILSILPMFYVLEVDNMGICIEQWSPRSSLTYSWYLFIMYSLIPAVALCVLNSRMARYISKHNRIQFLNNVEQQRKRVANMKHIRKVVTLLLFSFIVLVFPQRITFVVLDTVIDVNMNTYIALTFLNSIPYALHAAINPIIYTFTSENFRNEAKRCKMIFLNIFNGTKNRTETFEMDHFERITNRIWIGTKSGQTKITVTSFNGLIPIFNTSYL